MLAFPALTAAVMSASMPLGLGAPALDDPALGAPALEVAPQAIVEREQVIDFGVFGVSETKSWGSHVRCPSEAPYLNSTNYHPGSVNILPLGVEIRSTEWAMGSAWPIGNELVPRDVGLASVTVTNGTTASNHVKVVLHCVSS